jgi:hypothetical protein
MPDTDFQVFRLLRGQPSWERATVPTFRKRLRFPTAQNNLRRTAVIAVAMAPALALGAASAQTHGEPSVAALRICTHDPFPGRIADFHYVILNAWDWRRVAAIKKRSPDTKVLVYKNMTSTRRDAVQNGRDQSLLPTGVGYAYAEQHHPRWFLRDMQGRLVSWTSAPDAWQMDIGNRGYERLWRRNVARELRAHRWDGVFVDGATADPQTPWALNGRVFARYPTALSYQRATTRFFRRVAPAIRRRGRLFVANVNDGAFDVWRSWLGYASGTSREWWTKAQTGRSAGLIGGAEWGAQLRQLRTAEALHKIFIAITYGPADDARSITYARASFLLAASSPTSALAYSSECGTPAWTPKAAAHLGAARGPATRVGPVWRRDFAGGVALVNPSSVPVPVVLGGSFRQPNGSLVSSVVIAPVTGVLLQRP